MRLGRSRGPSRGTAFWSRFGARIGLRLLLRLSELHISRLSGCPAVGSSSSTARGGRAVPGGSWVPRVTVALLVAIGGITPGPSPAAEAPCCEEQQSRPAPREVSHLVHDLVHVGLTQVGGETLDLICGLVSVVAHRPLSATWLIYCWLGCRCGSRDSRMKPRHIMRAISGC
jgi:hypothetical protein